MLHYLRKHYVWTITLTFALALLSMSVLFVARPGFSVGAQGPRIFIPGCDGLFLGAGKPGEVLEGTFEVGNFGSEPMHFSITAGCGCSSLCRPSPSRRRRCSAAGRLGREFCPRNR